MIIAIEGLPGAGKTTVVNYICKTCKGLKVVKEIINNPIKLKNQYYYLQSDRLKYQKAYIYAKKGYHVVLDRSHVSTLMFNYTRDKLYGFKSYYHIKQLIDENIISKYEIPEAYIYIKVPIEIGLKRKNRKLGNSTRYLWNSKHFLLEMEKNIIKYIKSKRVYVIENQGRQEDFYKKIDKLMLNIFRERNR